MKIRQVSAGFTAFITTGAGLRASPDGKNLSPNLSFSTRQSSVPMRMGLKKPVGKP